MTIPTEFQASKYPVELDSDQNLHLVHDALRVKLAEDYEPGQTSITIDGDISKFPPIGIITLTEQCNEINDRAISLYYLSRTDTTFDDLVPLPGFSDTITHPAKITNVTQNVMADHHNALKDALIAIETFAGVKGTIDKKPYGETMEGRINFLRKMVLSPRAWFSADKRIGLVPLTTTFKNESFRMGDGDVTITWDFGDETISNISLISVTDEVPPTISNVSVIDMDGGFISKTYSEPGIYSVGLTVENQYGIDHLVFEDFINARVEAPDEAVIEFAATGDQTLTSGSPLGGPYDEETPPKIRSRTNKFITMSIPEGINSYTLKTYGGEEVLGITPIDPIETYTWSLSDDLIHSNERTTRASYSIGGLYDLVLRCDTEFGTYRITTYKNSLDIIEQRNLWLFTSSSNTATSNEFGLISETFKTGEVNYNIDRNDAFLNGTNNVAQAKREFKRNTGFTINGIVSSGDHGSALLAYASGGPALSSLFAQTVKLVEFNGFSGTFTDSLISIVRPWNWIFLPFAEQAYFLFGVDPNATSGQNMSNQVKDTLALGALGLESPVTLNYSNNFLNGAQELINHVTASYDLGGEPNNGRFAVYRSAIKDSTGYFLRNDGVGNFFKLKQFYRTEGTENTNPVINIRKMQDMIGQVKSEGELVGLSTGVFFFNNSGNISAFNTTDGVWEVGNSTVPFKNFQDNSVEGFNDTSNTLLATSDGENVAYLSFDYSESAFIKYNAVDQTFSYIGVRPSGDQWILGVY